MLNINITGTDRNIRLVTSNATHDKPNKPYDSEIIGYYTPVAGDLIPIPGDVINILVQDILQSYCVAERHILVSDGRYHQSITLYVNKI